MVSTNVCHFYVRSGDYIGNVAREHLALASAMKLELFIVLTKTDLVPNEAALKPALLACANVLRACCIEGVVVRTAEELHLLLQSQTTRNEADLIHKPMKKSPIFVVSCVTGIGLSLLKKYLFCVRGPSSNQHIASLPAVENPKSAEQRSGHLILILDQYRIDQPVIDGAEFRPIGTAQSAECSAPASIVSPSAALKQLSLKDSRSADEELRESSLNSTLILFGSVQSGTVNVGDMV